MERSIATAKEALRTRFSAFRDGLDEAAYAERSAAIVERAKTLPELVQAKTVHAYWPMPHRREVDVRPLIGWLQASGKQVVLPVVVAFGKAAGRAPRLRHVLFEHAGALCPNRWGIYEPIAGKSVPIEDVDAVIVPALGAGRNGHRIGHGYGYYDEFLRALRVPRIGLVYDACLVDTVPFDAHDVLLSVIATEREIIRPAPRVTSLPGARTVS